MSLVEWFNHWCNDKLTLEEQLLELSRRSVNEFEVVTSNMYVVNVKVNILLLVWGTKCSSYIDNVVSSRRVE